MLNADDMLNFMKIQMQLTYSISLKLKLNFWVDTSYYRVVSGGLETI